MPRKKKPQYTFDSETGKERALKEERFTVKLANGLKVSYTSPTLYQLFFKLEAENLGLSVDQYFQQMIWLSLYDEYKSLDESDNSQFATHFRGMEQRMKNDILATFPDLKKNRSSTTVSMSLSAYSEKSDPIKNSVSHLALITKGSVSSLLRELHIRVLRKNGIDSSWPCEKDELEDIYWKISELEKIEPYGWRVPLIKNAEVIKKKPRPGFRFLFPGNFKRKELRVTIKHMGHGYDPVRDALEPLCRVLWCSNSHYFKMLYMYFLDEIGMLDEKQNLAHTDPKKFVLENSERIRKILLS